MTYDPTITIDIEEVDYKECAYCGDSWPIQEMRFDGEVWIYKGYVEEYLKSIENIVTPFELEETRNNLSKTQ